MSKAQSFLNILEAIKFTDKPTIGGSEELVDSGDHPSVLTSAALEPNTPPTIAVNGKEKLIRTEGNIEKWKGEYGAFRYLYRKDGDILGGIQVVTKGQKAVLSNIFIKKDYRKQGIGNQLFSYVQRDLPKIKVSSDLTQMGAKFFKVDK